MELLGLFGVFGRRLLFKSSSSLSLEFSLFENTRDFLAIDLGVFGVGGAAARLLSIFFELLFETDLKKIVKLLKYFSPVGSMIKFWVTTFWFLQNIQLSRTKEW